MALEIKNLNVKISVNQPSPGNNRNVPESHRISTVNPETLTRDIVEQVMNIIEDKDER